MRSQIEQADFVLIVLTETYRRRLDGKETAGTGLGAVWEGQLITNAVYDTAGRNCKFFPVVLQSSDLRSIPDFLVGATRFDLSTTGGYTSLYRLLTSQPAVVRPAIGPVIHLPSEGATEPMGIASHTGETLFDIAVAHVLWRLPRGFLILDDLQANGADSWSTVASYYRYEGTWVQSTHYHESYAWRNVAQDFDRQCAKLGVPIGDWPYAYTALHFMVEVREGRITVGRDGTTAGDHAELHLNDGFATVVKPGPLFLPTIPDRYRPLAASGHLRDLAAEMTQYLDELGSGSRAGLFTESEIRERIGQVRRELRLELARIFSPSHPATLNAEEIITRYSRESSIGREEWLRELRAAALEAAQFLEDQVK